jgi:uncharacterized protein YdhG (YjbR/CyaY superfamily)
MDASSCFMYHVGENPCCPLEANAMTTSNTKKKPTNRTTPAKTVADYLATVPKDARAALLKLRADIKAAAPDAIEGISYQVPVFKLDGKPLVGFGAATAHCTFYVMSTSDAMRARLAELKTYKRGGGSIQFPASKPLPAALVTKLVKARIAEVEKKGPSGALR